MSVCSDKIPANLGIGQVVKCGRGRAMSGIRVFTGFVLVSLLSGPAWSAGSAEQGRRLAERWCASCHLVGPGQREASTDVPTFASIARREDLPESLLAAFLSTPHPRMPNMALSRQEIADVLAYIRSLRQ